ncbi:MAG: integration host factor subunit beta [candidate division WOR-3 bacterium]|jgi:integration host factor subunit beta|nr:integration host factor subunit beta [candidate division WOR-3 bacterium]MCR4423812.1 integration host factor subunit beta [candidate division WOR-3 bacterium]MDH7519151.1 HU family DNA-binding protein [bacterium]
MTITKADIVETISRQMAPNITKRDVGRIVQLFIEELCRALQEGNRVEIRGFGVLSTKLRKPKVARNPRTKATVNIPPRRVPVFKASRLLKASLMKGGVQ